MVYAFTEMSRSTFTAASSQNFIAVGLLSGLMKCVKKGHTVDGVKAGAISWLRSQTDEVGFTEEQRSTIFSAIWAQVVELHKDAHVPSTIDYGFDVMQAGATLAIESIGANKITPDQAKLIMGTVAAGGLSLCQLTVVDFDKESDHFSQWSIKLAKQYAPTLGEDVLTSLVSAAWAAAKAILFS
eukprot:TRINITY_DN1569_c0_g1_i4.p1 TRINITY_DN1569_c0_g1~~TRINITY_DN1569_c0_g1_i4.p1  ORF type:complete len:184 (-),score=42.22 TRINITY_DN1569_c0_g1_i4:161-712(-)